MKMKSDTSSDFLHLLDYSHLAHQLFAFTVPHTYRKIIPSEERARSPVVNKRRMTSWLENLGTQMRVINVGVSH